MKQSVQNKYKETLNCALELMFTQTQIPMTHTECSDYRVLKSAIQQLIRARRNFIQLCPWWQDELTPTYEIFAE